MTGLTTKGRYATRVLVYMAARARKDPVKKKEIAEAEGITPDYIEQILMRLKAAGLIRSHRGKSGGFSLAVDPARLTVDSVLQSMEGTLSVAPCQGKSSCRRAESCSTRALWKRADRALQGVFASVTIGGLADEVRTSAAGRALDYEI